LTVSHDRFFLDKVATQILAFSDDGVEVFNGNYSEYHEWDQARRRNNSTTQNPAPSTTDIPPHGLSKQTTSKSVLSKNQLERMQRRIAQIEASIPDLEARLSVLSGELSSPEASTEFARSAQLTEQIASIQAQIEALYSEWNSLAEQL
jgi:ATPase subunit of ABC transporter with duplicated ATPase domains